jgi:putative transposase
MGGRRYRLSVEDAALYFVTTSTANHIRQFNNEDKLTLVTDILYRVVKLEACFLMGFVIMPNHVHLLIGTQQGGNQISKFMHSFKGNVRKNIEGDKRFWQQRFDDLVITTEEQFRIKMNYIHWNPVKDGLVEKPEEWKYSSYRFGSSVKKILIL